MGSPWNEGEIRLEVTKKMCGLCADPKFLNFFSVPMQSFKNNFKIIVALAKLIAILCKIILKLSPLGTFVLNECRNCRSVDRGY